MYVNEYGNQEVLREVGRLKARTVETRTKPGYYADGGGLYLKVSGGAGRSWVFRYRVAGRLREMGLGSAYHRPRRCTAGGGGLPQAPATRKRSHRGSTA